MDEFLTLFAVCFNIFNVLITLKSIKYSDYYSRYNRTSYVFQCPIHVESLRKWLQFDERLSNCVYATNPQGGSASPVNIPA